MEKIKYPWLQSYPDSLDWNLKIENKPVFSLLQQTAENYPTANAFDFFGKKYDWQSIWQESNRLAKGLQDQGLKKGDRVALFLPNTPYYLIAYYAVMLAGACVVNLNPLYAQSELDQMVKDASPAIIITTDLKLLYDKLELLYQAGWSGKAVICSFTQCLPFPKNILYKIFKSADLAKIKHSSVSIILYEDLISNDGKCNIPDIDTKNDLAVLQYTGGTTGTPKAAMLTHQNIYSNTVQCLAWFYKIEKANAKMLGVLPFFHVFAMTAVMNFSVANALEIVALPRFDLKETLKTISKKRPQLFPAVPAIYSAINHAHDRKNYDLSSLKYCLSGGAPLPVEVKKTFEALYSGCVVLEGYGLTESSPVATVNPVEGKNPAGSIGLPLPGTIIEIIDPSDKKTHMPLGERGELCIRGPQVMKGYWNNPEATKEVIKQTEDGDWRLYTGDVALMDEQGYIYIVDRIKDMIITNAYKVYPRNVEEALYKHEAVEECIVAGLPDEKRGEIVKAWIKIKSGSILQEQDLRAFLADKLSPMEIPKIFEFRETNLPKTMIGKLSRKEVIAQEKKI